MGEKNDIILRPPEADADDEDDDGDDDSEEDEDDEPLAEYRSDEWVGMYCTDDEGEALRLVRAKWHAHFLEAVCGSSDGAAPVGATAQGSTPDVADKLVYFILAADPAAAQVYLDRPASGGGASGYSNERYGNSASGNRGGRGGGYRGGYRGGGQGGGVAWSAGNNRRDDAHRGGQGGGSQRGAPWQPGTHGHEMTNSPGTVGAEAPRGQGYGPGEIYNSGEALRTSAAQHSAAPSGGALYGNPLRRGRGRGRGRSDQTQ